MEANEFLGVVVETAERIDEQRLFLGEFCGIGAAKLIGSSNGEAIAFECGVAAFSGGAVVEEVIGQQIVAATVGRGRGHLDAELGQGCGNFPRADIALGPKMFDVLFALAIGFAFELALAVGAFGTTLETHENGFNGTPNAFLFVVASRLLERCGASRCLGEPTRSLGFDERLEVIQ